MPLVEFTTLKSAITLGNEWSVSALSNKKKKKRDDNENALKWWLIVAGLYFKLNLYLQGEKA